MAFYRALTSLQHLGNVATSHKYSCKVWWFCSLICETLQLINKVICTIILLSKVAGEVTLLKLIQFAKKRLKKGQLPKGLLKVSLRSARLFSFSSSIPLYSRESSFRIFTSIISVIPKQWLDHHESKKWWSNNSIKYKFDLINTSSLCRWFNNRGYRLF